jgi:hypothetical protein
MGGGDNTFSLHLIYGSNSDRFFEGCDVLKESAPTAPGSGGNPDLRSIKI